MKVNYEIVIYIKHKQKFEKFKWLLITQKILEYFENRTLSNKF